MTSHSSRAPIAQTSPGSRIVISGGTVVSGGTESRVDVAVVDGVIVEVGTSLSGDISLDATDSYVSSGFVDLHTHLREPGREEAETIETGSRAAALGGYTAVVAMPNTDPAQDSVAVVEFVRNAGKRAGLCDVFPSGCITVGRHGEQLAPYAQLSRAGVHLFTDDGNGVQDPLLMRRALEYSRDLNIVLAQHCEVSRLTEGAVMHEGECCTHMGVPGWPALAEELMLYRDIELVRVTGAPMHFLHLSTAGSVELVRSAKRDGLPVTAEVTPHHLSLTDEHLTGFDPLFKVNPPLRTREDIDALIEGVRDGTIDAVATDHAPHTDHTKQMPLDQAPPGMLGLQTALAVTNTVIGLSPTQVVDLFSVNPARIAGIADQHARPIAVGEPAHIAVWDLATTTEISRNDMVSKSRNTPYHGMTVRGRVRHTMFGGEIVVQEGKAQK
jgi:dihydroorotase